MASNWRVRETAQPSSEEEYAEVVASAEDAKNRLLRRHCFSPYQLALGREPRGHRAAERAVLHRERVHARAQAFQLAEFVRPPSAAAEHRLSNGQ